MLSRSFPRLWKLRTLCFGSSLKGGHLRNRRVAPAPRYLAYQARRNPTHGSLTFLVHVSPGGQKDREGNEGKHYRCFCLGSFGFLQPGFAGIQIQAAVLQDPPLFLEGTEHR